MHSQNMALNMFVDSLIVFFQNAWPKHVFDFVVLSDPNKNNWVAANPPLFSRGDSFTKDVSTAIELNHGCFG